MAETFTIDELAQRVGMTTRNIRAHQTRGLLPPPALHGRTGRYGREHLERLQQIKRLQDEGLNLNAIALVLGAGSEPQRARVRQALTEPWATEEPVVEPVAKVAARLGGDVDPGVLRGATGLGIVEPVDDSTVRVLLPAIIRAGESMLRLGVPLSAQLDVVGVVDEHVRAVAAGYIALASEHLAARLAGETALEPVALRDAVEELRAIAADVLLTLFHRAMTEATEHLVTQVLDAGEWPAPPA